jgi:hypothetical protein
MPVCGSLTEVIFVEAKHLPVQVEKKSGTIKSFLDVKINNQIIFSDL